VGQPHFIMIQRCASPLIAFIVFRAGHWAIGSPKEKTEICRMSYIENIPICNRPPEIDKSNTLAQEVNLFRGRGSIRGQVYSESRVMGDNDDAGFSTELRIPEIRYSLRPIMHPCRNHCIERSRLSGVDNVSGNDYRFAGYELTDARWRSNKPRSLLDCRSWGCRSMTGGARILYVIVHGVMAYAVNPSIADEENAKFSFMTHLKNVIVKSRTKKTHRGLLRLNAPPLGRILVRDIYREADESLGPHNAVLKFATSRSGQPTHLFTVIRNDWMKLSKVDGMSGHYISSWGRATILEQYISRDASSLRVKLEHISVAELEIQVSARLLLGYIGRRFCSIGCVSSRLRIIGGGSRLILSSLSKYMGLFCRSVCGNSGTHIGSRLVDILRVEFEPRIRLKDGVEQNNRQRSYLNSVLKFFVPILVFGLAFYLMDCGVRNLKHGDVNWVGIAAFYLGVCGFLCCGWIIVSLIRNCP
jgi:hypothetical protein